MTDAEWLTCTVPDTMLVYARNFTADQRKFRLFAIACIRQVYPLLSAPSKRAVEVIEELADDLCLQVMSTVTGKKIGECLGAVMQHIQGGSLPLWEYVMLWEASRAVAFTAAREASRISLREDAVVSHPSQRKEQADFLRDIFGNPYRPVTLPKQSKWRTCETCDGAGWKNDSSSTLAPRVLPCACNPWAVPQGTISEKYHYGRQWDGEYCPWFTPTVLSLAQAAYEEQSGRKCDVCDGAKAVMEHKAGEVRGSPCSACQDSGVVSDGTLDPDRLAILADAIEDMGCPSMVVCDKCSGSGTYTVQVTNSGLSAANGYGAATTYSEWRGCPKCGGEYNKKGTGHIPNPILAHLRGPGPHVRGCWVVDFLTRREGP